MKKRKEAPVTPTITLSQIQNPTTTTTTPPPLRYVPSSPIVNVKKIKVVESSSNQQPVINIIKKSVLVKDDRPQKSAPRSASTINLLDLKTTTNREKRIKVATTKLKPPQDSNIVFDPKAFLQPDDYKQKHQRPPPDQIIAKQKPVSLDEVIGHDEAVKSMRGWIDQLMRFRKDKVSNDMPRALMLVGPSGVGKTLCAELLLHEHQLNPIIYSTEQTFHVSSGNETGPFTDRGLTEEVFRTLNKNGSFEKCGVILDSLQGLNNKSISVLIDIVSGEKGSRINRIHRQHVWMNPLIITVDLSEFASLTKLARHCHVIEMGRVATHFLKPFFVNVCQKEHIDLPEKIIDDVVQGSGGDVRRLLNTLHFFALNSFALQDESAVGQVIDIST